MILPRYPKVSSAGGLARAGTFTSGRRVPPRARARGYHMPRLWRWTATADGNGWGRLKLGPSGRRTATATAVGVRRTLGAPQERTSGGRFSARVCGPFLPPRPKDARPKA